MESSSSLVYKAKTALHSAAAKAERVITEIKADFGRSASTSETEIKTENSLNINSAVCQNEDSSHNPHPELSKYDDSSQEVSSSHIPKKMREQEFWRRYFTREGKQPNSEKDRKRDRINESQSLDQVSCQKEAVVHLEMESPEKDPTVEEAYVKAFNMVSIPSILLVRQLALAIEIGHRFKSMKDLATANKDSLQGNERSGFVPNFSAIKILSLRDKDERRRSQLGEDGEYQSLLWSLFETDTQFSNQRDNDASILSSKGHFLADIHGAPPCSFVVQLAEIIAGIKTLHKMAQFWLQVVAELRKLWNEGQPIPLLPVNDNPDLRYCLLHQKLQAINCCIARKKHRIAALKLVDSSGQDECKIEDQSMSPVQEAWVHNLNTIAPALYAKTRSGVLIPRLGVLHEAANVTMLETGEPVFSPITQEGPILTEDLITETEELILRTGSVGAGCSQLFSDMQAFKAANPGCILEDFVRWYSPPDWREEPCSLSENSNDNEGSSRRGYLSSRMQSKGNLWRELWDSARPIPAAKQVPLFDEDLAGESTLSYLQDIAPSEFFEQLFIVTLSSGFAISEASPATKKDHVSKWFKECKEYVISTCRRGMDTETLGHLCQVYETMEAIVVHPQEGIFSEACESTNNEITVAEIQKGRLKKLGIHNVHLPSIDKNLFRRNLQEQKEQTIKDDNQQGFLSRFIDGKSSLFGKKSPKPTSTEQDKKLGVSDSEWMIL